MCTLPAIGCSNASCGIGLSVALNGQQFSIPAGFALYAPTALASASPTPLYTGNGEAAPATAGMFTGGNTLALGGAGFFASKHAVCRFGGYAAGSTWNNATFRWEGAAVTPYDFSLGRCASAAAQHAGLHRTISTDFSAPLGNSTIFGAAAVRQQGVFGGPDGNSSALYALELTSRASDDVGQTGSFAATVSPAVALLGFSATFAAEVEPSDAPFSLHFAVGPLPNSSIGTHSTVCGAGGGLEVCLGGTGRAPTLEVFYKTSRRFSAPLDGSRLDARTAVSISHEEEGLTVDVGGTRYVDALLLRDWAPPAELQFGVSAASYATAATTRVWTFDVVVNGDDRRRRSVVEFSANGQQFTASNTSFVYEGAPTVASISPTTGPVLGSTLVTLYGVHFDSGTNYLCRFGEYLSAATQRPSSGDLACHSPPSASLVDVPLEVSLDNVSFSASGYLFRYYEAVPAGTVTPRSGLSAGGGRCTLQGGGGGSLFGGDDYKCAFDGVQSEATYDVARDEVTCVAPAANRSGVIDVALALNGQQFAQTFAVYKYHTRPALRTLSPRSGPAVGRTVVAVRGDGFDDFDRATCRLGTFANASVQVRANQTVCVMPPAATAGASISIFEDFSLSPYDAPRTFGLEWYGGARLRGGALYLTWDRSETEGSAIFLPRAPALDFFRARFSLALGDIGRSARASASARSTQCASASAGCRRRSASGSTSRRGARRSRGAAPTGGRRRSSRRPSRAAARASGWWCSTTAR